MHIVTQTPLLLIQLPLWVLLRLGLKLSDFDKLNVGTILVDPETLVSEFSITLCLLSSFPSLPQGGDADGWSSLSCGWSLPVKKQFFLPTIPKCLIIENRQIVGILSLPYFTILRALRCLML